MRRLIAAAGFQLYAFFLAGAQWYAGVHTDEAKYLLNIPYPHPPLARWIMGITDGWAYQDLFWRIVFATLLVQAVWLVFDLGKGLSRPGRTGLCAAWLLNAAVASQAGTVMMAPLTALQMLVFVWLLLRGKDVSSYAALIGLLWLASLFTAYQAVLFAPLALGLFARMRIPVWQRAWLFLIPLGLLTLYTGINPLAAASMVNHAGKDVSQTLAEHLMGTGWIWVIGGSGLLSIVGTIGLLIKPRIALLCTLFLVCAYVFLSRYDYYAILFAPLLVIGLNDLARRFPAISLPVTFLLPFATILVMFLRPLSLALAHDPQVLVTHASTIDGNVLIAGSFGHEWQYASVHPVRRYHSRFLVDAGAVVCLTPCEEMQKQSLWQRLPELPVEVWLKKQ